MEILERKLQSERGENDEQQYDLIIIGAGLSGSHAAYTIKKKYKNMKILMIEGKDRVGGRTETIERKSCRDKTKKVKWDLGGQWVGKTQRNVMRLINELGVETHKQYNEGKRVLELNGKVSTYNKDTPHTSYLNKLDMNNYIAKLDTINDKISVVQPYRENNEEIRLLDSRNMKEYLDSISYTPTLRSIFNSNIRAISGLEADQVNGLFGLMQIKSCKGMRIITSTAEGGAQESTMKGGSQQLTIKMLDYAAKVSPKDSFRLLLNTQLIQVKQDNGVQEKSELVEITTQNTQTSEVKVFRCKKLISSIPINQYVNIKFSPELPLFKRNVFKYCQIGNYIKFFVTYKRAFWRENGYSALMMGDGSVIHLSQETFDQTYSKQPAKQESKTESKGDDDCKTSEPPKISLNKRMPTIGALVETYDATTHDGEPAIVGFFAGNAVHEWGDMTLEIRRAEVIESLASYFGPQARQFSDYFEKNWAYEPFGGGCPSLNVISGSVMKDYARATREPFLNVHFCGTESATEWIGYMDGAIESGERVANEILHTMSKSGFILPSKLTVPIDYEKTYFHQLKEIDSEEGISTEDSGCRKLHEPPNSNINNKSFKKALVKPIVKYQQHFEISNALLGTIKKLLNIF